MLKLGQEFRYDGEKWKVVQDGFILEVENLNPHSNRPTLMIIGNVDDVTLYEKADDFELLS